MGKDAALAGHQWNFFRAGGFDQIKIENGADLQKLDQLDQKLWVALGCPTNGLEFDVRTLSLLDSDGDGRIRASEILAAVKWTCDCLKDPQMLFTPGAVLPLEAIDDTQPEGKQIQASAKRILASLGKADAGSISVEDTADTGKVFAQTNFNGDGILPVDAAEEPIRSIIADIIACCGSETDRSGKPGVSQALADRFFTECRTYADWRKQAVEQPEILPLGENTGAAAEALAAVKVKIDDYFARCRLAAFDIRAMAALNREEKEYLALAAKDLTIDSAEISALPIAQIGADQPLPLFSGVNPAWSDALARFRSTVVKPLLGEKSVLTDGEWSVLKAKLGSYQVWVGAKPSVVVEKLGPNRVQEILSGGDQAALNALIAQDKALAGEFEAIISVDRLVRYRRDLVKLLNNFISFRDFYNRKDKAIFQAGTLFLDQRSCELCIKVEDMAKHVSMSHLSRTYLLYCECQRRSTNEKMTVVVAVTDGEPDNLTVGRNGIFYDRRGRDWDATVVKIVENPISIREAFWSPYKRLIRWIEEQVAKRAAAADTAADAKLQTTAQTTVAKPAAPATGTPAAPGAAPTPPKSKFDVGVIAALGVAVGGITAALGALLQSFFGLGIWMPLGLVGLLLMISGPSMLIAWLKMRHRNLGPLLDANGWAINAKAKINIPFGKALTGMAKLPEGARRDLVDAYAEKHGKRRLVIALLIVLLLAAVVWYTGLLDSVLPAWLTRVSLFPPK